MFEKLNPRSAEIIKSNQQLKEIDENLNIGNYVSVILEILNPEIPFKEN